ncbi:hypothetical protein BM1374166_00026 [Bartonella tribocorum]|nr:hypothetical protein BM1374166_00026 [Bartonella tribocorum]
MKLPYKVIASRQSIFTLFYFPKIAQINTRHNFWCKKAS